MTATAIEVQEKPILFSGPMVRAILDGRKTQSRRVVKPQPGPCDHKLNEEYEGHAIPTEFFMMDAGDWACRTCGNGVRLTRNDAVGIICPYGRPGGNIWVREAWQYYGGDEYLYQKSRQSVAYKATWDSDKCLWKEGTAEPTTFDYWPETWRPSIHMPRWASRITLELTKVRVERVQEISEEESIAEGVKAFDGSAKGCFAVLGTTAISGTTAKECYQRLWDSINLKREGGKYSWAANPFVWAIEFRRVVG
ncbi:MAG TPA: hypothetical protein VHV32_19245 [Candidatus Angelobacter sp.]|nr:hypothetical protein [Candidatus Angelobacter sp.]